jgi:hypothetical protein
MSTPTKIAILQSSQSLEFVEMPATHIYQLTALHQRLHKELDKLTARQVPELPDVIAECEGVDIVHSSFSITSGLTYINRLEQLFSKIEEKQYPLISLLTEIRALQAQLEQWVEEEFDSF